MGRKSNRSIKCFKQEDIKIGELLRFESKLFLISDSTSSDQYCFSAVSSALAIISNRINFMYRILYSYLHDLLQFRWVLICCASFFEREEDGRWNYFTHLFGQWSLDLGTLWFLEWTLEAIYISLTLSMVLVDILKRMFPLSSIIFQRRDFTPTRQNYFTQYLYEEQQLSAEDSWSHGYLTDTPYNPPVFFRNSGGVLPVTPLVSVMIMGVHRFQLHSFDLLWKWWICLVASS